jgi:hypothetical protein
MDSSQLEKIPLTFFEPFLKVTRPELAPKESTQSRKQMSPIDIMKQQKLEKARAVAKQYGLELGI